MDEKDLEALLAEPRMHQLKESLIRNLPQGITPEEAGKIINQGAKRSNSERMEKVVKTIVSSVTTYIQEYKGITNGEIEAVTGAAYHLFGWEVDKNVLGITTKNFKTFKERMKKRAEKSKVHDHIGKGIPIRHKGIIKKRHTLWYDPKMPDFYARTHIIDHERALSEEDQYTTSKHEMNPAVTKDKMALEESVKKETAERTRREERTNDYRKDDKTYKTPSSSAKTTGETITNAKEFSDHYLFGDNNFADNSTIPLEKEHIQKHLKDMNVKDKDVRRQLRRSIIRDYELQKMLYSQGKSELSQQKLYHFANLFNESKEFRKDLDNVFNMVKE